jgi:catechol 2,3-dioxygenase-like lactoylglutathione lyase family enzyme
MPAMRIVPAFAALALLAADPPPPVEGIKPALDVGIVVTDQAKAREFYGEILGLKEAAPLPLPAGGEMLRFQFGGSTIKVLPAPANAPKYAGPVRDAIGFRLVAFIMNDVAPIVERMKAKGLPEPKFTGNEQLKYAIVADPDGNAIELVQLADTARNGELQLGFTVGDAEKTRAFYRDVMGLKELESRQMAAGAGTQYRFQTGKTVIKFWAAKPGTPVRTGEAFAAAGLRYFTYLVRDVDAVHAEFVKRGAKIGAAPADFGNVARIMFVADPDGNWIEFAAGKRRPQ